jgi:hypothetical protein
MRQARAGYETRQAHGQRYEGAGRGTDGGETAGTGSSLLVTTGLPA